MQYRSLSKGELVCAGDEVDMCCDQWRDNPKWVAATCIGEPAPDPAFPSHRQYRRPLKDIGAVANIAQQAECEITRCRMCGHKLYGEHFCDSGCQAEYVQLRRG